MQSAGRLQVKQAAPCVSFSDTLFCIQAGLRPAWKASRYPGPATQSHCIRACTSFFLFSGFCQDWPSRSTARFDAPADPGRLLAARSGFFFNLTYVWIHASGDVRFPGIPNVNKDRVEPHRLNMDNSTAAHGGNPQAELPTINSTYRSANVRML